MIYFKLKEYKYSTTAGKYGINNMPSGYQYEKFEYLVNNILDDLRDACGPMTITSGYRCRKLNKAVGGARNSQHQYGEAVDFVCDRLEEVYDWMKDNLVYDQLILERVNGKEWIHVSFKANRMQAFNI